MKRKFTKHVAMIAVAGLAMLAWNGAWAPTSCRQGGEMTTRKPDIEAEIRFLAAEEGGKTIACRSGYFPNHNFGIPGTLNDARHTFPDVAEARPGDTVRSLMSFLDPEAQNGRLFEGFEFTMQEGARIVGHGRITKVLNEDLRR